MAQRKIKKLSPAGVRNASEPGLYGDGAGLWLNVGPTGGKSWLLRYMLNGKAREMGLGPLHTIGLSEARERARTARHQLLDGIDPLDARQAEKARKAAEAAALKTFKEVAEGYIRTHRAAWRNAQHAWQWTNTLERFVYPVIGDLPVGTVDTGHVTKILEPIWVTKAETAARVRGRIEVVLDYAKTHRWRTGDNPARWRGHLQNVLPSRAKVARVEHHPALPWREIGAFMATLGNEDGTAALALRLAILTAARTNEVIGATWGEIGVRSAVWTVSPSRMKAGKEHRVPLSEPALAVLREAAKLRRSDAPEVPVFPGGKHATGDKPLSNMAMLVLLRRMGRADLTVHGFRSSFRDWAGETGKPDDIAEAALAHMRGDKTQTAYQRGDLLERRRRLMDDWAAFCARPVPAETGQVVAIRAVAGT
jgi:integrase